MNKYLSQMLHIPNELKRSRHLSFFISSCSVSLSHLPPFPQISEWEQSAWERTARARVRNGWKTESVFFQTTRASPIHLPQGSSLLPRDPANSGRAPSASLSVSFEPLLGLSSHPGSFGSPEFSQIPEHDFKS